MFVAGPVWAVCFGVLLFSSNVVAQAGGPQATIAQLNHQAMEAYGNLQFPEAMQLLQQAEALCNQYNLRGPALARTYVNMGMVEFGGSGNNAGALDYFKKAVCLDRSVMLDPLNSTPDVEMLFKGAQNQAQAPGGCGGAAPQPAYPQPQPAYPQPQPGYPQPQPGPATMQLLQHTQVTQQVRLTPIPIFARVNPNVQVGQVILFYRTIGERIYQQVPMQPRGSGYSAMIGCDVLQTFDPTGIEYYIAVLDTANRLLGTSGNEAQPHQTSIVQTLTVPPPALPNESPPGVCREECPPWNPDCNSACKQFGDLCDSDSECCSGLACISETCTQTDGDGGGGGGKGWGEYGPHFRMSINAGTGAGLVTSGAEEPYNQVSDGSLTVGTGFAWSKFHIRANPMIYLPVAKLSIGLSFRGDIPMLASGTGDAAVSKNRPKPNPLEPSLLLNVAYRIVGSDDHRWFELNALFGLGWMNILNRVSYQDCQPEKAGDNSSDEDEDLWGHSFEENELICDEDTLGDDGGWGGKDPRSENFFRKSGPFGVELGLDGYVWFVDNFGLNFGLLADVLMPNFVLNFDIQAGIAVRF